MEEKELSLAINCACNAISLCTGELGKILKTEIRIEESSCKGKKRNLEHTLKETIEDLKEVRKAFTTERIDKVLSNLNTLIYKKN